VVSIFIILISILVLDHFINKSQIKKWDIEVPELKNRYVNKLHKYGEKILYWVSMIVMILAITEFHHLRILIFISPGIMFTFRTIMEWIFAKDNKTYLLSAVTSGLFIIGSVVYGILQFL